MTTPSTETLEREREKLYVTDAELIRRLGVPEKVARLAIRQYEAKAGFPKSDALMGNRRYWPAVKAWLDKWNRVQ
jgi:hypothetical protein